MICPDAEIIDTNVGNISTGPGFYLSSKLCTWTIAPQNVSSIQLIFREFATELGFDFLNVFQCSSIACTAPKLLGAFSGIEVPAPIISKTGIMKLQFISDQFGVDHGFEATFIALCPSGFYRNKTGECALCMSTCQDGKMLSGQCRSDISLMDQMHCDCPAGQFSPSPAVACQPCTRQCGAGEKYSTSEIMRSALRILE